MSDRERLIDKLNEQLRFLTRSCEEFDAGNEDEALRMAVSLRVLLHDTKHSVSLLTHLGLAKSLVLSSSRGIGDFTDFVSQVIDFSSPTPVKMKPLFGERFREVTIETWWRREVVFVDRKMKYFRKTVILSAANKDGGAHVDRQLEHYYETLRAGKCAIGMTPNMTFHGPEPYKQGVTYYPKNAHFVLLRQFSHEILVSAKKYQWAAEDSGTTSP